MKKLLYIVPSFNPLKREGIHNRVTSFCNCFSQAGYDVTVAALPPAFSCLRIFKERKNITLAHRCIILPFINTPHRQTINNIFTFFQRVLLRLVAIIVNPDIVLVDSAAGINLTTYIKQPVIGNFRADVIDEYKSNTDAAQYAKAEKSMLQQVRNSVKRSNYSICVSKNLQNVIEEQAGLKLSNNFIFPCCAKISRFNDCKINENNSVITLGYFGGLHSWQCVEQVLQLAIGLRRIDSRYKLLILTGSNTKSIKPLLDKLGEDNYEIHSVSQADIPSWVSKMDVSFALRADRSLNRVSSPTKLSESLAAGVPVVVTEASGDWAEIVTEKTGLVLPGLAITDETINKIHQFCCEVKNKRMIYFNNCREAVKDRTWENYATEFIKFIEE